MKILRTANQSLIALILFLSAQTGMAQTTTPESNSAQKTESVHAKKIAVNRQSDRLIILTNEYNETAKNLAIEKTEEKPDQAKIASLERDLTALRKEIKLAQLNPVPATYMNAPARAETDTHGKASTAKKVVASASQPQEANPNEDDETPPEKTYESWDIFQNFGRKKGSRP